MLTRYFLIAFGLCWLITVPIALHVQGLVADRILPLPAQWLIGFVPLLAAFWVTRGTDQRPIWMAAATSFRAPLHWYLFAILTPWIILGAAWAVRMLAGLEPAPLRIGPHILVFALVWLLLAWGEETGWRAYALPRLVSRHGFWMAATLLGMLWCVWHYPKLYASPYLHLDIQGLVWVGQFSIQIFVANYLLCWLYLRSGSVGVASVFHASWNLVATVHILAALDFVMTGLLALLTAALLVYDQRRGIISDAVSKRTA